MSTLTDAAPHTHKFLPYDDACYTGHAAKIDAILQMLRYAEDNDDLTAGLVVAAIGACR
jgi:hypothetical protein